MPLTNYPGVPMSSKNPQRDDEGTRAVKGIRDLLLLIVIVALIVGVIWLFVASNSQV